MLKEVAEAHNHNMAVVFDQLSKSETFEKAVVEALNDVLNGLLEVRRHVGLMSSIGVLDKNEDGEYCVDMEYYTSYAEELIQGEARCDNGISTDEDYNSVEFGGDYGQDKN
jgi:hypothetical protein